MPNSIHPLAGKPLPADSPHRGEVIVNVSLLLKAYHHQEPDLEDPAQRVAFGTSGHRGTSLQGSFNRPHVLAITQALCEYRLKAGITGPLFVGIDTHALSRPALETTLEVLAANEVPTLIQEDQGYTPTPLVSHAILTYNRGQTQGLADGVILTPSHNPPQDGGFKYNPPHGGPAGGEVTRWIEERANEHLREGNRRVRQMPLEKALDSPHVHPFDFITPYVHDLRNVVDLDRIRASGLRLGVDPLGGASVGVWEPIANHHDLSLEVVNRAVDPTFGFLCLDRDGKIRMDCSSPYAMAGLVNLSGRFDLAFGNDADSDRHGIVTHGEGLMNPNHYLSAAIHYLFSNRPRWSPRSTIGKTLVSSLMIDRVAASLKHPVSEVPVGFKWFVEGLLSGECAFAGEESAGATFLRSDGTVWTTDKDGIVMGLLAAEMTAATGRNPAELYRELTSKFGEPLYERLDAPADARCREASPESVRQTMLAGEPILSRLTRAPGNGAPIGGIKIVSENGWFAARPSGTENIYKIYAESFKGREHLERIQEEALALVREIFARRDRPIHQETSPPGG